MGSIVNLRYFIDSARRSGYKSTDSAVAEIIDNSLDAEASDILVICTLKESSGRNAVKEIAILDNGHGMDEDRLDACLGFGNTTRQERKGMGRFGVGLPQASLHVCPRVEVCSWTQANDVNQVYLDEREVKKGIQEQVDLQKKVSIPSCYQKYISGYRIKGHKMDFSQHGTLVVWKDCDNIKPKTYVKLQEKLSFFLGRKFRHFLNKRSEKKCTIGLTVLSTDQHDKLLKPNDPLLQMDDNVVLGVSSRASQKDNIFTDNDFGQGVSGEPIFSPWTGGPDYGKVRIEMDYKKEGRLKQSSVIIKYSMAKEKYHAAGGESQVGQKIKHHVGVSIVRAGREIDFRKSPFFSDVNEPQHRWWGCEISFQPELDEVFGISNNKQQVELADYDDEAKEFDIDGDKKWEELHQTVRLHISELYKQIKERKKGGRSKKNNRPKRMAEEALVANHEKSNPKPTLSEKNKQTISEQERQQMAKENLEQMGCPDPSENEVKDALEVPVKLIKKDLGEGAHFIMIDQRIGNVWLSINTSSMFYKDLYLKIEDHAHGDENDSILRAFNLLLMAFARAEDEAGLSDVQRKAFRTVREAWGLKIREYLEKDYQS